VLTKVNILSCIDRGKMNRVLEHTKKENDLDMMVWKIVLFWVADYDSVGNRLGRIHLMSDFIKLKGLCRQCDFNN